MTGILKMTAASRTESGGPDIRVLPTFPNMRIRDLQKIRRRNVRPGGVGVRAKDCRDPAGEEKRLVGPCGRGLMSPIWESLGDTVWE